MSNLKKLGILVFMMLFATKSFALSSVCGQTYSQQWSQHVPYHYFTFGPFDNYTGDFWLKDYTEVSGPVSDDDYEQFYLATHYSLSPRMMIMLGLPDGYYTVQGYVAVGYPYYNDFDIYEAAGCTPYFGYIQNNPLPTCGGNFTLTSNNSFTISTTPSMPGITATVTSLIPSNASVSWEAQIEYTAAGSSCTGGPTFDSNVVTGSSATSFSPSFNDIYGGTLRVKATCSAPGYTSGSLTKTQAIIATEPDNTAKLNYIGSGSSPFQANDIKKVACHESSVTQFTSGNPLLGGTGDVGIMQVCHMRTDDHFWDWKENIDYGKILLNDAKNFAQTWLNKKVNENGASAWTTSMHRQEAIHRYWAGNNTNSSVDAYWDWTGLAWTDVKNNDGQSNTTYVSSVESASCPGI